MEFYEILIKMTVLVTCITVCSGFVLVESDEKENGKGVENRILYLLDLLEKLKQITDTDNESDIMTSYDDDVTSYNAIKDNAITKQVSNNRAPGRETQSVDDTLARVIDIHKKDFAILPPANEWCRMMGFRRCRQSHS